MNFDASPFFARRERLARTLVELGGGVAIVATANPAVRNGGTEYPFRFDSSFYYLTGFREPEAVLVMVAGADATRSLLFCREKDMEREIWDGYRFGPEQAGALFAFDEAHPVDQLDVMLPDLLADQPAVFHALGADAGSDARLMRALDVVRRNSRSGIVPPATVRDVRVLIDEMRLFKDAHELDLMRRAAKISAEAHARAMCFTRPGHFEYQVEAEINHCFRMHGSESPAYPSIVAGGPNSCVLHYVENRDLLKDGDLLLIDAGCELDGYASDITRTFPVNGRFSGPQRAVYEIVLAAQQAAIDTVRVGAPYNATHDAALRILVQGMLDLGLLDGSLDGAIESKAYMRFYMHRTGHWLGLDVHDVGTYKIHGNWRPLAEDQVLTIEPGFYIRPGEGIPERFWHIGIRIEDDVRVTANGPEVLTREAPKTVDAIESLMRATF